MLRYRWQQKPQSVAPLTVGGSGVLNVAKVTGFGWRRYGRQARRPLLAKHGRIRQWLTWRRNTRLFFRPKC